KEDLIRNGSEITKADQPKLYISHITNLLDISFESVSKFYRKVGYWGLVEIKLSVEQILGLLPIPLVGKNAMRSHYNVSVNNIENHLSWQMVTSVANLEDPITRQRENVRLGKDIHWSFGINLAEGIIIDHLKDKNRWIDEKGKTAS
ncbi:MAG: hypothetical protein QME51_06865, partial [Planctomycetota bacterium]|nr:hypothetical protein [Planctomycetota bacterium]MDI6788074.1 hypothetical protein [Planctomycetota bacterium]